MEDCEQVLQNKMAISRPSRAFGVDTPPRPGDEGGGTPLSEYSLDFKMSLCPGRRERATDVDVQNATCCLLPAAYCPLNIDDISLKYIDPRLPPMSRHNPIETPCAFTLETQPNLGIFPSPTSAPVAPVAAAHRDGKYTTVTSTSHQLPLLPPKRKLSAFVRYPCEEESITSHTRPLRVTRSGGLKPLNPSPSNHSTMLSPRSIRNTSTKSSQS